VKGYTLIEILIVLVIISIISTFAVLTIGYNKNKQIEILGNKISNLILLAEEQAILQPAVFNFVVSENTFQFYQFDAAEKKWRAVSDDLLKKYTFPAEFEIALQNPPLIISSNGETSAFVLLIGKKNKSPVYKITGAGDGTFSKGWINEK